MSTQIASYPDILPGLAGNRDAQAMIALLASGGDARITLDPESGLNRYLSTPYPRKTVAYASSTANDLSLDAFTHLLETRHEQGAGYGARLERLRARIRSAYELSDEVEIIFAPSGTDLEYVALAAVHGRAAEGVHNVLLGADEVGSGCILSADGRYFADETALACATLPGSLVEGFGPISLADVAVRCAEGFARSSAEVAEAIAQEIALAEAGGRHALVHVVHGSKTGLILPEPAEFEALQSCTAGGADFVVDACQARITTEALHFYLDRGAMVLLTGSKFMGGPPFSGFALVPRRLVESARPLPQGLARVFRRPEFPATWAGAECLPEGDNPGLALRLEASIFELERFQRLPMAGVERIITAFVHAIRSELSEPLGLDLVAPLAAGAAPATRAHPIEMRTLATLDVSTLPAARTFADAQALHRRLALGGVRLGQPAKCVRMAGEWGGTLRVGLSMPQITRLAQVSEQEAKQTLVSDMQTVAQAIRANS